MTAMNRLMAGFVAYMARDSETLTVRPSRNPMARERAPRNVGHLNRSRRWRWAGTYAEARALSPFPERPVR